MTKTKIYAHRGASDWGGRARGTYWSFSKTGFCGVSRIITDCPDNGRKIADEINIIGDK